MQLKFKNITPEIYSKLKHVMGKMGVEMEGESGDISTKGIKGNYALNADDETLEIAITKTPMLVPKKIIAGQIKDSIVKMGGEVIV